MYSVPLRPLSKRWVFQFHSRFLGLYDLQPFSPSFIKLQKYNICKKKFLKQGLSWLELVLWLADCWVCFLKLLLPSREHLLGSLCWSNDAFLLSANGELCLSGKLFSTDGILFSLTWFCDGNFWLSSDKIDDVYILTFNIFESDSKWYDIFNHLGA